MDLDGATTLAEMSDGDLRAVKLRDGRVALVGRSESWIVEPHDRLKVEYGGLAAAVGAVPVDGLLLRGDARIYVYEAMIDEYATSLDAASIRDELQAVLRAAAQAAGAEYVR